MSPGRWSTTAGTLQDPTGQPLARKTLVIFAAEAARLAPGRYLSRKKL